jgi:hypothetical protein
MEGGAVGHNFPTKILVVDKMIFKTKIKLEN